MHVVFLISSFAGLMIFLFQAIVQLMIGKIVSVIAFHGGCCTSVDGKGLFCGEIILPKLIMIRFLSEEFAQLGD